jgi:hypothetical protein
MASFYNNPLSVEQVKRPYPEFVTGAWRCAAKQNVPDSVESRDAR